jgi:putative ABC transport system ATP-binding protein
MNDACTVRTVDLVKEYDGGAVKAVKKLNLEVPRKEFLCIMGPSGSGKSSLLNLLGALDRPTRGDIFLNGRSLLGEPDLDRVRAEEVGFVFQLHNLLPVLTCVENVEIPMIPLGISRRERKRRAEELLDRVGLSHRLRSVATKLSGGERQRVSIARALINRPSLILADEPTGDVDSVTGDRIMECIMTVRKAAGATLIVVTHNPELAKGADRVMEMRDGNLELSSVANA